MTAPGPALVLALPGQWQALPLGADDEIAAEIAAFVRAHFGRRDDQATLRNEQRARLGEAARRARDAGALQFHLSLTAPGGAALASTVAEYRPQLPLGSLAEPAAVADALVRVLATQDAGAGAGAGAEAGADTAAADTHWDAFAAAGGAVFDRGDGLVLRTSRRIEPVDAERDAPTAIVDYWLTVPDRADVVLLSFTTALAELAPLITELFDAIVSAAQWSPAPRDPASSALRAELAP